MARGASHSRIVPAVAVIRRVLAEALKTRDVRLCVALSGGLDSSVLLHALAGMGLRGALRAVYINHGLQPRAEAWGEHCAALCANLGVPFSAQSVTVVVEGEGIEAAARRARYDALFAGLETDEALVTAHHLDDQAETILLNLMRGSGPAGLAGMAAVGQRGERFLLRPLLAVPQEKIRAYAVATRLSWIEDPSNEEFRFDRNFLRHQLLPLLAGRWPSAIAAMARSASLCAESAGLLEELARLDAASASIRGRVSVEHLARLGEGRQRNLLRHLARRETGTTPPWRCLREGLPQLLGAGIDRQPLVAWEGGEIRRFRGLLHVQKPIAEAVLIEDRLPARAGASLDCGGAAGRIRLEMDATGGLDPQKLGADLRLRFRAGGESLRPVGSASSRPLKKLFQEAGVLPWMRSHVPLLYAGERLVSVADLWLAAEAAAKEGQPGLRVYWEQHPPWR